MKRMTGRGKKGDCWEVRKRRTRRRGIGDYEGGMREGRDHMEQEEEEERRTRARYCDEGENKEGNDTGLRFK